MIAHKGKARFAGAWFRVRDNHLPISFADATVARFRAAFPDDDLAPGGLPAALIASYEGDRGSTTDTLTGGWRQGAPSSRQLGAAPGRWAGRSRVQILFTPWVSEQIPMLRDPDSGSQWPSRADGHGRSRVVGCTRPQAA